MERRGERVPKKEKAKRETGTLVIDWDGSYVARLKRNWAITKHSHIMRINSLLYWLHHRRSLAPSPIFGDKVAVAIVVYPQWRHATEGTLNSREFRDNQGGGEVMGEFNKSCGTNVQNGCKTSL